MTVLWLIVVSAVVLGVAGRFYSGFISRRIGEDNTRPTPAVARADGQDYVPTPTPVLVNCTLAAAILANPKSERKAHFP